MYSCMHAGIRVCCMHACMYVYMCVCMYVRSSNSIVGYAVVYILRLIGHTQWVWPINLRM